MAPHRALPWVGASDSISLHNLCNLAGRLRAGIAEHGPTYEARGRHYSHPGVAALLECEKALTNGLRAFGATPADRGKMGVSEVQPPNRLELLVDRMAERRRERDQASSGSAS